MFTKSLWKIVAASAVVTCGLANYAPAQTYYPPYVNPPRYPAPADNTPVPAYQQYPQYTQYPAYAPPVTPAVPQAVLLAPAQIDQLVGPVALYPDPLLAQVLPAATYPQDITAAQQWLQACPNVTEEDIQAQSWDPSIKALVHYPTVLQMLNDNMDWTQALGVAFMNQPTDLMDSVQRLRQQAQVNGTLQSTPQQQVVLGDNQAIQILPADPQVIYVPMYDPQVVFLPGYAPQWGDTPRLWFGLGSRIGNWLDNDCDWAGRRIAAGGGWHFGWLHDEHGWVRDQHADAGRRYDRAVPDNPYNTRRPPENARNSNDHGNGPAARPWTRNAAKPAPVMPAPVAAAARQVPENHRGWPASAAPTPPTRNILPIAVPRPTEHSVPATAAPSRGPQPPMPNHHGVAPAPTPAQPNRTHPLTPLAETPAPAPTHNQPRVFGPPTPAPAAQPAAKNVFGDYQSHTAVQQAAARGHQSTAPASNPPAPAAHPASAEPAAKVAPKPPTLPVMPHPAPAPVTPTFNHGGATPSPAAQPQPGFPTPGSAGDTRAASQRGHASTNH